MLHFAKLFVVAGHQVLARVRQLQVSGALAAYAPPSADGAPVALLLISTYLDEVGLVEDCIVLSAGLGGPDTYQLLAHFDKAHALRALELMQGVYHGLLTEPEQRAGILDLRADLLALTA